MICVKQLEILALISFLGCATPKFPNITKCTIINSTTSECINNNKIYDLEITKMRAYQCISPGDYLKAVKYIDTLNKMLQENL